MKKVIPRHCVIIAVGPNGETRNTLLAHNFNPHEIISAERVAIDLLGDANPIGLSGVLSTEMKHRASLKLSLGERVVFDAANLRREDRLALARVAAEVGVPVFYLLADPSGADDTQLHRWQIAQRDLARGDGVAEVIDSRNCQLEVVPRNQPSLDEILSRWSGITLLGDVHGMQQSLLSALAWARGRNHYVIFLGDVIDYGPQTLEVADMVYTMVMRGEAELILGNHERKIARWINRLSRPSVMALSEGNKVTTNALNDLSSKAANQWAGRFIGLIGHASHIRVLGDFVLAHASIHPNYWSGTATYKELETSALFGEFESVRSNVYVPRTYRWVDQVPLGKTVVVGHDIRSTSYPISIVNDCGGRVIFLDTGCGKGGSLSSADLRMGEHGLQIQNYYMY